MPVAASHAPQVRLSAWPPRLYSGAEGGVEAGSAGISAPMAVSVYTSPGKGIRPIEGTNAFGDAAAAVRPPSEDTHRTARMAAPHSSVRGRWNERVCCMGCSFQLRREHGRD